MIYQSQIIKYGKEAQSFLGDKLFILFGENVPKELEDYCFIAKISNVTEEIKAGMRLSINQNKYIITAVGKDVKNNLENLGHITVQFNGRTTPELPGTIYIEDKDIPDINIDDTISIGY